MSRIVFFDTEITVESGKLYDIGAVKDSAELHTTNKRKFLEFVKDCDFICGHNIIAHDLKHVNSELNMVNKNFNYIDTLLLSPLLFPRRPYHKLVKDDKIQADSINNPLNDSKKARDLFFDEVSAFNRLPKEMRRIFCSLLYNKPEFQGFFRYLGYVPFDGVEEVIKKYFHSRICANANVEKMIMEYPIELAYSLSVINTNDKYSIVPPWVIRNYPEVNRIIDHLRNKPCKEECEYCKTHLDAKSQLKKYFNFDEFRKFCGEPIQENAVKAAIRGESLLAIFPTGGGKSITFQLPALISGDASRGLTVVISPLQSLMKDQVDNLTKKGIIDAVTINGLLDPIERASAIERVANGMASILYISPESLRSASVDRLLQARNVVRFVIDEAHCFSAWGQDFRVDYMFIGDYIRELQEKKQLKEPIPVSCFSATAKQKVISDISDYFREKLGITLEKYTTNATRSNLRYEVLFKENEEEKYAALRYLIKVKHCPTIVYVSRTKKTEELANRLSKDGLKALPFNGKMNSAKKIENQNAFIQGGETGTDIIVATSAFGMGVDKDNVGLVVHYDISDSLENYIQEAGRAGRNQEINAECYILFNDSDLDKHFALLTQTKLSINEIQQVWKAVKELSKQWDTFTRTPLEIARAAGWDNSDIDVETRVKTAIYALEDAGYVKRGKNVPRIYATGILAQNMQEASARIEQSSEFSENEREQAKRIIKLLISERSRAKAGSEEAESRVDYIADTLGLSLSDVVDNINKMREISLLEDSRDMLARINLTDTSKKSSSVLSRISSLERFLLDYIPEEGILSYKEVNEIAINEGLIQSSINDIKTVIIYWMITQFIEKKHIAGNHQCIIRTKKPIEEIKSKFEKRIDISNFIIDFLYSKCKKQNEPEMVLFSVIELVEEYNNNKTLFSTGYEASVKDIEEALLYLSKIQALSIEGGFLVIYNAINIQRLVQDNKIKYKKDDYRKLQEYYEQRIQQIHIVGEFANMMTKDYNEALTYVSEYFSLDYQAFKEKYFRGTRKGEINKNITPQKFNKLFGELSHTQRKIIDDNISQYIVVTAGPGSGKTKVLVHKLASLLLLEEVKSEQLLMLTFSRSAATEFKMRLIELIGDAAYYVEIKTFHSFSFDLLGRVGSLQGSQDVVKRATNLIKNDEADIGRITKSVLVIDEAQDMDAEQFALVESLISKNEDIRVIAVGDDDQNIYEFKGSSSKYLVSLMNDYDAVKYEMTSNYRSDKTLVTFANRFASTISKRMKSQEIVSERKSLGVVSLTKFDTPNLEIPTLNLIRDTYESGTACVLTSTNEEALRMVGLLNKNGYDARLIQSNDGFNLRNLKEIRTFLQLLGDENKTPTISNEQWNYAVKQFSKMFEDSSCYNACLKMFDTFKATSKDKYWTDFVEFIQDSQYEDFIDKEINSITVSTIHKSKGREFDSVYMMLNNYSITGDDKRRPLYVGITRAKRALYINYNNDIFDGIIVDGMTRHSDINPYSEPDEVMLQLSFRGIVLDYCKDKQSRIGKITSGDILEIDGDYLLAYDGKFKNKVLKLSKQSVKELNSLVNKGYKPYSANARFVIYWKSKEELSDEESMIVLPDIWLRR